MTSEKKALNAALMDISALPDTFAYRQNTGQAWQGRHVDVAVGEYVRVTPGMRILAEARPISFGLPGAGDIVGHRRGFAFQVEMKTLTGPQREEQRSFERAWKKTGGIYVLARSAGEAVSALEDDFKFLL
ncbi:hypothetical protein U1872_06115 [Sphingomonas sp. RB3P16]|uniref:hypothetical protein n=1 Tax=Parasphingomonas frigoris TaxID=3096163 RepID=UPI002FCA7DF2